MAEEKKGFFKRLVAGLDKDKRQYRIRNGLHFQRIFQYRRRFL